MRPSSADTSEPACVKRKMLSMNSSVSAPVSSRKYSAIVSARQGDAETRARRLVHLAEDHDGLVDDVLAGVADLGFLHFQPQVGAFAGALADAGEDRVAAVLLGDAGDEFLDDDRLAEARAAEQAGLAAAEERREQVDHLDAGLEHLGLGGQVDELRRLAVDRAALASALTGPRLSIGSPSRLNTRPSVSLPTGTVTGPPVSATSMPRRRPSVEPERDRADASAAEVLLRLRRSG